MTWPGAEVRRYRDHLYLLPAGDTSVLVQQAVAGLAEPLLLPAGLGSLVFHSSAEQGLSEAVVSQGLELRFRNGGEEIKLPNQLITRKLKKLLQEEGVVPWMRDRLPC